MEYEPTDPETKKIWFLDYIRGRIGHEFTMEEVTTRGSLVWLCDDPSILSNSREYNVVKLKAYFIMTTFYIDGLVEKVEKNKYRITNAGLKRCAEVMVECGLSGANDF